MAAEPNHLVTQLLQSAAEGDEAAARQLLPLVYDELRELARFRMKQSPSERTLQPTALVHEAYLRMVGSRDPAWRNRRHFFGAAALAMRAILVDAARRRGAVKRGGDRARQSLEDVDPAIEAPVDDVVALDMALRQLEAEDPRKGQIVNLRYFAGLTAQETAEALDTSLGTVEREWRFARAWLQVQIEGRRAE